MSDVYYGPNWDQIRQQIIENDGKQCVICLSDENLVVHHRKPIRQFESHKEANKESNLATLCKRCHRRIESITDRHTRRGLRHFQKELSAEGCDVSDEFIKYLCERTPRSNASKSTCCISDDCFYPVKPSDWRCPKCGASTGRGKRVRRQVEKDHENENRDGKDTITCPSCNSELSSENQLISHMSDRHDLSRIAVRKHLTSLDVKDDAAVDTGLGTGKPEKLPLIIPSEKRNEAEEIEE